MRPTVSILTTGVGPNQASGVGPVPLDKPTHPDQKLTLREMEVLNVMSDVLSTKEAARLLGVTVKNGG
jgi:DNA-binding NarL/FixJ family response regulator